MTAIFALLRQFWIQFLILLTQIIVAVAGIVLPRFLNTPSLEIVSATILVDEASVDLKPSISEEINSIASLPQVQDALFDLDCEHNYGQTVSIPLKCVGVFLDAIAARKSELEKIDLLLSDILDKKITSLNSEQLSLIVRASMNPYSTYLNIDFTSDDSSDPSNVKVSALTLSTMQILKGEVARKLLYLSEGAEILTSVPEMERKEPRIAIRVIAMNTGEADAIVFPQLQLSDGGVSKLAFVNTGGSMPRAGDDQTESYVVIKPGSIEVILFFLDPRSNGPDSISYATSISQRAQISIPGVISLNETSDKIEYRSAIRIEQTDLDRFARFYGGGFDSMRSMSAIGGNGFFLK